MDFGGPNDIWIPKSTDWNDDVDDDDVDNDDEEEEWKVKQHNYIALILLVLLSDKNHGNPHSE